MTNKYQLESRGKRPALGERLSVDRSAHLRRIGCARLQWRGRKQRQRFEPVLLHRDDRNRLVRPVDEAETRELDRIVNGEVDGDGITDGTRYARCGIRGFVEVDRCRDASLARTRVDRRQGNARLL